MELLERDVNTMDTEVQGHGHVEEFEDGAAVVELDHGQAAPLAADEMVLAEEMVLSGEMVVAEEIMVAEVAFLAEEGKHGKVEPLRSS
jgi:hypothetical protein